MKKVLSIIVILAFVISVSSCGNKKKKTDEHVGTHTHEDGTVHADDAHAHPAPAQESFEVKSDNDAEHKHEGGDGDEKGHKHEGGDGEGTGHDEAEHGHEHGDEAGHDHDHEHGEHK